MANFSPKTVPLGRLWCDSAPAWAVEKPQSPDDDDETKSTGLLANRQRSENRPNLLLEAFFSQIL